jgi:hypothetical protein
MMLAVIGQANGQSCTLFMEQARDTPPFASDRNQRVVIQVGELVRCAISRLKQLGAVVRSD